MNHEFLADKPGCIKLSLLTDHRALVTEFILEINFISYWITSVSKYDSSSYRHTQVHILSIKSSISFVLTGSANPAFSIFFSVFFNPFVFSTIWSFIVSMTLHGFQTINEPFNLKRWSNVFNNDVIFATRTIYTTDENMSP